MNLKSEIIYQAYGSRRPGTYALGVQTFGPADREKAWPERYAMIFCDQDSPEAVVGKLRALADAVESRRGSVTGETMLTGNELNAAAYPALVQSDPGDDPYCQDFWPLHFANWQTKAIRTFVETMRAMPFRSP